MSKKDTSYTVSKFQKEAHSERYNVRESALTKVKNGNLNGNIEKIVPTIRWIALNDCSRRVRACAIEVCNANNITAYGNPIELPTEAVEMPCNIDNIILDVFFRCKIPPNMDCFDDSLVARIINKFSNAYKNEFAIMNDIFSSKKQLVDWIKSKYSIYNNEYEKQEAIAESSSTKIETDNMYCEKTYGKEQFLTDIKSRYRDARLRAVGKAGNCLSLKTEMGEEYENAMRNIALHDCNRDVRDLAAKICNRFNITDNGVSINPSKQAETSIQLPENIVEIMESVFKTAKVGHATTSLNLTHIKNIHKAFIDLYPNEYAIIRNKYTSKTKYEKWLKERLAVYHKRCVNEIEAKIKSGDPIEDDGLEILKKKANYNEVPGDILSVNYRRLPPVKINHIRKCSSYGFEIVASKSTRLYQIRNAISKEVVTGNNFEMYPQDIEDFIEDYEIKHPLMLPQDLLGLYFPDLNVRLDSTYKKVGEDHKIREYVDMFKQQHAKSIKEYMIRWCGKKNYGRTNPGVDHSLCLIFDQYLKNIGAKQ